MRGVLSVSEWGGLLIGLALGLWIAWSNWPAGDFDAAHLNRAFAEVIGASFVGWLVGRFVAK